MDKHNIEEWKERSQMEAKEMIEYKKCRFRIGDEVYVKNKGRCVVSNMLKLFNPFNYSPVLCVLVKDKNNNELKLKDYKTEIINVFK
jgi:hypothetical protein